MFNHICTLCFNWHFVSLKTRTRWLYFFYLGIKQRCSTCRWGLTFYSRLKNACMSHDFITREELAHIVIVTPPHFIEVPIPSPESERSVVWVLSVSQLSPEDGEHIVLLLFVQINLEYFEGQLRLQFSIYNFVYPSKMYVHILKECGHVNRIMIYFFTK